MREASERGSREVVVIGGGLAGLTAANLLARAGRRVTVVEKSSAVGGRAATHGKGEFRFNLGPHALYRGGHAARTVSHALVTASAGGTAGRPGPAVPGIDQLYVAGDWVGPDGMLADASLASAKRAADLIAPGTEVRTAAAA